MANLKYTDYMKLEKLFEMGGGYVLNFSNASFQQFFRSCVGLDIYSNRYETYGDSKAKRLRAFLELESDKIVGKVIADLVEHWRTSKMLSDSEVSKQQEALSVECKNISDRLLGLKPNSPQEPQPQKNDFDFLKQDFGKISLKGFKLEGGLIAVLTQRIAEIDKCLEAKAALSAIFLSGSTLEGILLGIATQHPQKFNQANAAPKDRTTGKVLQFHQWSLSDLINVAHEIQFLDLDVKRFSHVLRDFRNFIHPYEQWRNSFNPDENTALICCQVLKAAIHDLNKV
jgi:hypothetical protein